MDVVFVILWWPAELSRLWPRPFGPGSSVTLTHGHMVSYMCCKAGGLTTRPQCGPWSQRCNQTVVTCRSLSCFVNNKRWESSVRVLLSFWVGAEPCALCWTSRLWPGEEKTGGSGSMWFWFHVVPPCHCVTAAADTVQQETSCDTRWMCLYSPLSRHTHTPWQVSTLLPSLAVKTVGNLSGLLPLVGVKQKDVDWGHFCDLFSNFYIYLFNMIWFITMNYSKSYFIGTMNRLITFT